MTPKEIAAQYDAKVFDSPDAAKVAGFVLGESMAPRNVWNKASAASAIVLKLLDKKASGQAEEIGLVIEPWSVTGCYKPQSAETACSLSPTNFSLSCVGLTRLNSLEGC